MRVRCTFIILLLVLVEARSGYPCEFRRLVGSPRPYLRGRSVSAYRLQRLGTDTVQQVARVRLGPLTGHTDLEQARAEYRPPRVFPQQATDLPRNRHQPDHDGDLSIGRHGQEAEQQSEQDNGHEQRQHQVGHEAAHGAPPFTRTCLPNGTAHVARWRPPPQMVFQQTLLWVPILGDVAGAAQRQAELAISAGAATGLPSTSVPAPRRPFLTS